MSTNVASNGSNHRPLWIGITSRRGDPAWLQRWARNYLFMVASYKAVPIVLAPDSPAILPDGECYTPDAQGRVPEAILERLDGLILSGGGDVDPQRFGQPLAGAEAESIDAQRDELEIGLAQAALDRDLPLFGICRGCQVLNVAAGGSMIQHLDDHRSPVEGPTRFHPVQVKPGSRFASIVQSAQFDVNTFHHQGMDQTSLAPIFQPAALAQPDSWLVEAYESPRHRWVVGVQWHPERIFELSDPHRFLWEDFINACARGRG